MALGELPHAHLYHCHMIRGLSTHGVKGLDMLYVRSLTIARMSYRNIMDSGSIHAYIHKYVSHGRGVPYRGCILVPINLLV